MKKILVLLISLAAVTAFAQTPVSFTTAPDMSVSLRNSSNQAILALIVDIMGIETKTIYRHDFFTKTVQFDPGASLSADVDPQQDSAVKQWKITVVWCQFVDGSQWGDQTRGKDVLDFRAGTLAMLNTLASADDATFQNTISHVLSGKIRGTQRVTAKALQMDIDGGGIATARPDVAARLQAAAARRAVGTF